MYGPFFGKTNIRGEKNGVNQQDKKEYRYYKGLFNYTINVMNKLQRYYNNTDPHTIQYIHTHTYTQYLMVHSPKAISDEMGAPMKLALAAQAPV